VCYNCGHLAIDKRGAKFRKLKALYGKDPKTLVDKLLAASKRITRCDCTRHTSWLQPKRAEAERVESLAQARVTAAQSVVDAFGDAAHVSLVARQELDAAKLALRAAVSTRARFSTLQYEFQFDGVVLMKRLKALKKKDGKEISDEEREQWRRERDWHEVGGTCAARACKRAGPFPPSTPQVMLLAARAALKSESERENGRKGESVEGSNKPADSRMPAIWWGLQGKKGRGG
jgi:hypothetical protein